MTGSRWLRALLAGSLAAGMSATPLRAQGPAAVLGVVRAENRLGPGRRIEIEGVTAARRDLRWVGTALGAAGLGLAGGLSGAAYCGNSEHGPRDCTLTTIVFAVAGGVIGGLVGHFIGRAIKI